MSGRDNGALEENRKQEERLRDNIQFLNLESYVVIYQYNKEGGGMRKPARKTDQSLALPLNEPTDTIEV